MTRVILLMKVKTLRIPLFMIFFGPVKFFL